MTLGIGVDVGGTKIAAGVVDEDGTVLATVRESSPATDRQAIIDTITRAVRGLRQDFPEVATVGVGAAGFVAADRNTMAHGTNLDWTGMRIADAVSQGTGLPAVVENDANAFGWAEFRFGAARGRDSALVVAIGTGVGGAVIADGRLVRGAAGFAAEIGHINVVPDGRPCGCGLYGCLERYASGTALGVNGWELAKVRPAYTARIIELSGGDAERISGKAVTAAAREGDPAALECYARLAHWLGVGLADLCAVLDPEVIVISGGLSEAGDILLDPARRAFTDNLTAGHHRPEIPVVLGQGGQEGGLVGAADLARQP
ncbi:ROK family glucokinase [Actinomyces wuliandei]|uniref:ROK family glucokinase n=1 Tax=Actinomyces wuliandei TaxID=2057743 RepID=UPI000FDC2825|nr:ROK family glucokinase [Actinomyces wuliandei]